MPGNGLALAVGVGGEDQAVGALDRAGDIIDALLRLGIEIPAHGEIFVGAHRTVLGGEVADMAVGSHDLKAGA